MKNKAFLRKVFLMLMFAAVVAVPAISVLAVPPVLTNPGTQTDAEGEVISLQLEATDTENGTLTFSDPSNTLPIGLSIDPQSGLIGGTLDFDAASGIPYSVTIRVEDDEVPSQNDEVTFTWNVTDVNQPPIVDTPNIQSYDEGETVNIGMSNFASDPDGDNLSYAASGLPASLTIDNGSGVISGDLTFTDAGDYSVEVDVTDDGTPAETTTVTFTLSVANINRPPQITASPSNQEYDEGQTITDLQVTATDPDVGDTLTYSTIDLPNGLSINPSTGLISGTLSYIADGTFTVIVRVRDNGTPDNLSDEAQFNFIVNQINRTPVLNAEPDDQVNDEGDTVSLGISVTDDSNESLTYVAEGGLPPGLSIDSGTGLISGTLTDQSGGSYTVDITVFDNGSPALQVTTSFGWTVNDVNHPPSVTNPGNQTSAEGSNISLQIVASDSDVETITYSATGLPPNLSINPSTGLISGQISYNAFTGTNYTVTVTVSDDEPSNTQVNFTWTVNNTNRAPAILSALPNRADTENDVISLNITSIDADGNTVTYSASNLPSGLAIDTTTGEITGTILYDAAANSPYTVTITLTDDGTPNLQTQGTFTWTINNVNRTPVVTDIVDQENDEGDTVSLQVQASDPDTEDTLVYTVQGLPGGLSINSSSGLISGTLSGSSSGNFVVTVTVTDNGTPATEDTSTSFVWIVNETTSNVAPQITNPGDQTSTEGDNISLQIVATDPDGDTITFSASNLPDGLTLDTSSGLISGTMNDGTSAISPYIIIVMVTDPSTLSNSVSFEWTVIDDTPTGAPIVTNPGDQTNVELNVISLQIVASDPEGNALTYSASDLPPDLIIDSSTGIISGTIAEGAAASSPYIVIVTVTDIDSLPSSISFDWVVNDNTLPGTPQITNPGAQTNVEGQTVSLQIMATDPESDALTFSASGLPGNLSINPTTGVISGSLAVGSADLSPFNVSVSVTDPTSLSASVTFTWTVNNFTNAVPINLSADVSPTKFTFRWTHQTVRGGTTAGAQYYQLLVYTGNFAYINQWYEASTICSGIFCEVTPDAIVFNGDYLWWVQGYSATNGSVWSDNNGTALNVNFPAPDVVTLMNTTGLTTTRPTIHWRMNGNAIYTSWFYVSVPGGFSGWLGRDTYCDVNNDCSLQSPVDLAAGTYNLYILSWGPGGYSTGGTSGFAGPQPFTVGGTPPALPSGMIINVNQGRPTISWDNDPNAQWYQIYMGRSDYTVTVSADWYEKTPEVCDATRCTLTPNGDAVNGSYVLWIRSWGPGGFSTGGTDGWAGAFPYTLNFTAPTAVALPVTSTNHNSGRPTFTFEGVAGATWYNVWVGSSDFSRTYGYEWQLASAMGCENMGTCVMTPNVALPNGGSYTWYLRSWGPGGYSTGGVVTGVDGWTAGTTLTVNATAPGQVTHLTPAGTVNDPTLAFSWQHIQNVSWYVIYAGSADLKQTWLYSYYPAEALACNDDNICSLTIDEYEFVDGNYIWYLQAYSPGGLGPWSSGQAFTVAQ